jgi:hypothetical protein
MGVGALRLLRSADSPSGQAVKLSQDRSQRLGPRFGFVAIGDALGVKAAQLDALSFLRRKRPWCAVRSTAAEA